MDSSKGEDGENKKAEDNDFAVLVSYIQEYNKIRQPYESAMIEFNFNDPIYEQGKRITNNIQTTVINLFAKFKQENNLKKAFRLSDIALVHWPNDLC